MTSENDNTLKASLTQSELNSSSHEIAPRCVSIDLEVGKEDKRIHQFAAVRGDTGESFVFHSGDLAKALIKLDAFADAVAFLLGHNLIEFDSVHLAAAKPDLRLLKLPMVDTLRLNPLAFPRNPYHHLVKHYKEGQLQRGSVNDPELDARLTLQVFADQLGALAVAHEQMPKLLLVWHWLTTVSEVNSGLNSVFMKVIPQALALLNGTGLEPEYAGEQRDRLLAGFRWILVDEYQVSVQTNTR